MQVGAAATAQTVRAAATRSFGTSGRSFYAIAGVLAIVVLAGLAAFIIQVISGLGAAGYNDQSFWSIYEANLVAFIAVSYGGALVSAILRLTHAEWRAPITRLAEAMALISLVVGMSFAVIHLGRPERVWRLIVTPQLSSPIVWDFTVIMTYLGATAVFLYLPLIPDLAILRDRLTAPGSWRARLYSLLSVGWVDLPRQRQLLHRTITSVAILIIPLAVCVHSVLSWSFALTGRPGWASTIFAPYFVVGALYAGVAMVILVIAGFRLAYHLEQHIEVKHFQYLAYLMLTLNLTYLYLTFSELITEGYPMHEDTVPVLQALLVGAYAPAFWGFVVGCGLVPLALVAIPRTRTIPGIVVASTLVVLGMWVKRLLIVVPAATHPLIAGPWGVFAPTWIPIAITLAAAAAIPLLLMLFFKVFPLLSIGEMEDLAGEGVGRRAALSDRQRLALGEGRMTR